MLLKATIIVKCVNLLSGIPFVPLDVTKGPNKNFTVYATTLLNPNMTVYIDNYTAILTPEYAYYGIQPTDTRDQHYKT